MNCFGFSTDKIIYSNSFYRISLPDTRVRRAWKSEEDSTDQTNNNNGGCHFLCRINSSDTHKMLLLGYFWNNNEYPLLLIAFFLVPTDTFRHRKSLQISLSPTEKRHSANKSVDTIIRNSRVNKCVRIQSCNKRQPVEKFALQSAQLTRSLTWWWQAKIAETTPLGNQTTEGKKKQDIIGVTLNQRL